MAIGHLMIGGAQAALDHSQLCLGLLPAECGQLGCGVSVCRSVCGSCERCLVVRVLVQLAYLFT